MSQYSLKMYITYDFFWSIDDSHEENMCDNVASSYTLMQYIDAERSFVEN